MIANLSLGFCANLLLEFKEISKCDKGQMTVELCIVFPVVIAIALITINAFGFFSECAQFDRVARNCVRIYSTSLEEGVEEGEIVSKITSSIKEEMSSTEIECMTTGSLRGEGYMTYTLTYNYTPTLFGMPLRASIFGVSLPKVKHSINMAVDPYSPGKWLWSYMK